MTSIGDQVRPGIYQLHSCFNRVVNFSSPGNQCILSVVNAEIGAGPTHIVFDPGFNPKNTGAPSTLRITRDEIWLDDRAIPIPGSRYSSKLELSRPLKRKTFFQNITFLKELVISSAAEKSVAFLLAPEREKNFTGGFDQILVQRFKEARELLRSDRPDAVNAASKRVRGLGWGLTPSGDDFISGLFMARHALGLPVPPVTKDGSLSTYFMAQTALGLFNEKWKRLIEGLFKESKAELEFAAHQALEIGATSGADCATGLILTAEIEQEKKG